MSSAKSKSPPTSPESSDRTREPLLPSPFPGRAAPTGPDESQNITQEFAPPAAPDADAAPEIPPGAESLITWDASPEESGHLIPEIPAEDEADVSADMADEGRGEAEQELRRAARTKSP